MNTIETKPGRSDRELVFELRQQLLERMKALPASKSSLIDDTARILGAASDDMRLILECKRIDLAFLESIHPTTKLPRFASMKAWEYKQGVGRPAREGRCAFSREGHKMQTDGCQYMRGAVSDRGEIRDGGPQIYLSLPPSQIPAAIEKKASSLPGEKFVTWEAVWEKAPPMEVKDPILYTVTPLGAFVVGAWDMTKLESYIASEFTT